MIFVITGSRSYPFDRLLKQLDDLCTKGILQEEVFAQIGNAKYQPTQYAYRDYLSPQEFEAKTLQADIVISHAASASVIRALKAGKKIIVVPRQQKYGEHIDDHQVLAANAYREKGYALAVMEMQELEGALFDLKEGKTPLRPWVNEDPQSIPKMIDRFITETWKS